MNEKRKLFGIGAIGSVYGALSVLFFFVIEVFEIDTNGSKSSGALYADGTIIMEFGAPIYSVVVRVIFFTCFASILCGIASLLRREILVVSLGALAFGIAPAFVYTMGSVSTFFIYYGLILPILGVGLYRVIRQHNKRWHIDAATPRN